MVRRLLLAAAFVLVLLEIPGAVEQLRRPDPQIQLRHLTVMSAEPEGPGALAGLRAGDELLAVDGEAVRIGTRTGELVAVYRRTGPELVPEVVFS